MDYSMEPKVRRPCTVHQPTACQFLHPHPHHHGNYRQVPTPLNHHFHHHHHLHASPQCPMHSFMLYSNYHSPECSLFTSHPKTVSSPPPPNVHSLPLSQPVETAAAEVGLMNEEWEEVDEDPVFVLTDEWREFFAKSEAKRRQEKKQKAKLKGKETDG